MKAASGSVVGTCVAIYLSAVAVNAQVEDQADWWPYVWLWLVLLIALLAGAVWVFLMVAAEPSAPGGFADSDGAVQVRRTRRWALIIALWLAILGFLLMVVGFSFYLPNPPLSQTLGGVGLLLLMAAAPVALIAYLAQLVRWAARRRGRAGDGDSR